MPSTSLQWLSLVGIIWLQSVIGTNTNFPAYSSQLKEVLSMSQVQLNNLAFASDAGKLFGFFSGFAALYLPLWLVLLIGSTLGLIGYGIQYLFITNYVTSLSYGHIFLLTILAGNSICWINTVCYVVAIRNFPFDYQAVAVGLSTSYQGLSAKIYTVFADALFSSSKRAKAYLLLNSLLPLLASAIAAPLVREVGTTGIKGDKMRGGFMVMFVITIITGVYAVISSLSSISRELSSAANAVGISTFLLSPLAIPVMEKMRELVAVYFPVKWRLNNKTKVYTLNVEENHIDNGGIERMENGVKERDDGGDEVGRRELVKEAVNNGVMEEIGVRLMFRRVEFWLYFFVYFFGATIGLVYLNNLGQIAESRGYLGTSSLVSLSSSFGFFGRLMPSLLDYFLSRYT